MHSGRRRNALLSGSRVFRQTFLNLIIILLRNAKIIPLILQNILEIDYRFILSIIKQQIGIKGFLWTPFFFVIFNFILFSNLLSLIPFGIALTSHLIVIL